MKIENIFEKTAIESYKQAIEDAKRKYLCGEKNIDYANAACYNFKRKTAGQGLQWLKPLIKE